MLQKNEMSEKSLAKLAYVTALATALRADGEVVGPTVRKLKEAMAEFEKVWANQAGTS